MKKEFKAYFWINVQNFYLNVGMKINNFKYILK